MVSRKLMACWAFVDFLLLAAGVVSIALSIVWRQENLLMNMTLDNNDLTAGTVLGVMLLITFVFSIGAVVQANHKTLGLMILNWLLLFDVIAIGTIGSFVWFYTLKERVNFHKLWLALSDANRITLQDQFKCCGYFSASDSAVVGGNFCTQTQVSFLNTLDTFKTENADFFCVKPITAFADSTLNNVFTTVYGFMAIALCMIVLTLCVIKKRNEEERFKKIDAKRGGHGFV